MTTTPRRILEVAVVGDVAVARFADGKIRSEASVHQLGQELLALVDEHQYRNVLINFAAVDYLSSGSLVKLIALHKKIAAVGGKLKLSNIRPEFYEVFAVTKLHRLFDITADEAAALAAF